MRLAGHEIWEQARRRTSAVVSDQTPAAELMENAVAQVSRYLDRIGAPLSPAKHGLLMTAFCRSLERYASRSARLELAGASTELRSCISDERWVARSDARLDLEFILRRLSGRNAQVLMLRAADYEWKEIADLLGTTAARVRNSFWREIKRIRWNTGVGTVA